MCMNVTNELNSTNTNATSLNSTLDKQCDTRSNASADPLFANLFLFFFFIKAPRVPYKRGQDVGIRRAHRVSFPTSSPALWTLNSYWPSFFVQRRVKNREDSRRKPPSRTRLEFHRVKRPSRKIRTRERGGGG